MLTNFNSKQPCIIPAPFDPVESIFDKASANQKIVYENI